MILAQVTRLVWHFLLEPFLQQDAEMMHSEQNNYSKNPHRRSVAVNSAILALQPVLVGPFAICQKQEETRNSQLASPSLAESVEQPLRNVGLNSL